MSRPSEPSCAGGARRGRRIGEPWWDLQSIKGWAGSLSLHAMLLLALACWYFSPRAPRPAEFDSQIAGSPFGLEDGDQLKGGSNGTPVALSTELDAAEPAEPTFTSELTPSETESPKVSLSATSNPLEAIAPRRLERELRPARGGRRGDGVLGNIGAGNGDGFGIARFGNGGEVIRGVQVKVGDPQFTLIWDTKSVDIDLHIMEPKGDHIYFGHRNGKQGGELDVDNTWGFGPENVYWLVSTTGGRKSPKVKGPGPPGAYRWSVHYYAAHRDDRPPVHWQVRIKHAGEAKVVDGWLNSPGEWSQIYMLKVHPPKDDAGGSPEPEK